MQKLTKKQRSAITQAFRNATTLQQQLHNLQQLQYKNGQTVYDVTHWDMDMERVVEELCECMDSETMEYYFL